MQAWAEAAFARAGPTHQRSRSLPPWVGASVGAGVDAVADAVAGGGASCAGQASAAS